MLFVPKAESVSHARHPARSGDEGWEAVAALVPRRHVRASGVPVTGHGSLSPNGAGWMLLLARRPPSTAWGWDRPSHLALLAAGSYQQAEASRLTLLKVPSNPKYTKGIYYI